METISSNLILAIQLKTLKILLIAVLAVISHRFLKLTIGKTVHKVTERRFKTILSLINNTLTVIIAGIVILIILDELNINIAPFLVSAGIAGVALGYGAQNLVRDFINGLFILSEDQIREGDLIKIGNTEGVVEKITLRSVVIREPNGGLHIINNSSIGQVTNLSRDWSQAILSLGVAAKQPIDQVLAAVQEAANRLSQQDEMRHYLIEEPQVFGIEEITGGKLTIKVKVRTKPNQQSSVVRTYYYHLKKVFEEKELEFA